MPNFYIVDVKHGNSAVLIDTDGVVVIDAGNGSKLLEFLSNRQITTIDVLILSHVDGDHIGGVMALLTSEVLVIKSVYVNSDASKNTGTWDDLAYTLYDYDKQDKLVFETQVTPDLTGKINQGSVHIEVLAPNKYLIAKGVGGQDRDKRKLSTNSMSVVIRLVYQGNPCVLLPGDIDHIGLDHLLSDRYEITAQLLVFPHHGGRAGKDTKAFTTQICNHVQPQHIVFSIAKNIDKFPLKEVVETISSVLPKTYMYTTNHSDIFSSHISQHEIPHKNDVGHIHIDLAQLPMIINYFKNNHLI